MRLPRRLTLETLERIAADAIMVNIAFATALSLRFMILFILRSDNANSSVSFYTAILQESIRAYRDCWWLLTAICLILFYLSGFYTYGRTYRSRYKALLILQAVSVAYLLFGFATYFLAPPPFSFLTPIPRSALVGSWVLTLLLVGGLRVGAALWRRTVWAEARIWGKPKDRAIRNVSVIGGAGYMGSVLVRKLIELGYNVTVLDALLYGDKSIGSLLGRPGFELIHDDFRNIEAVVRALQYADVVVHLGALVGDPACALNEKLTVEVNLAATRMIAEAARGFSVQRFIFASTCSVYGASDQILDERSALNPVSLYARTKIDSERVLLALSDDRFSPVILRFGTIYGLSPRPRFDLVINLLAARAVCEKSITIFGGDQWRPFIHVDDAAKAIIKCLEAPLAAVRGQIFNVGSDDQNYQIYRIGETIKQLMPEVQIVHKGDDVDWRNYHVSFAKIRKHLGFVPQRTVAEGILEIRAAIEQGHIEDYRDARYSNYKTLSEEGPNTTLVHTHTMSSIFTAGLEEDRELSP